MFSTTYLDQMGLCRLCLIRERVEISIFDESQLSAKINVCLPVKVTRDDKLPKKICMDCYYKLESFYQFYNVSAKAEQQLLSWLGEDEPEVVPSPSPVEDKIHLTKKLQQKGKTRKEEQASDEEGKTNNKLAPADLVSVVVKEENQEITKEEDDDNFFDGGNLSPDRRSSSPDFPKEEEKLALKPAPVKKTKKKVFNKKQSPKKKKKIDKKPKKSELSRKLKIAGKLFCERKGKRDYACTECDARFDKQQLARQHFKEKHVVLESYKCEHCDKVFTKLHPFKLHRVEHGVDKNAPIFHCDKCDFKTATKLYFEGHVARKHSDVFKFDCDHCGKKFKVKEDIRVHMGVHEDTKHMCDVCGKFYPSHNALVHHRRVKHINTYEFVCPVCNFKFISQLNLDNHVRDNHDPNNPHKCNECGQQFKVKRYLYRHQRRVHQKIERPHLCTICGKSFICANTYRIHYLTHTKIKPYMCNVCGDTFSQRSSLMLHWKKKHPDADEPPPPLILTNVFETLQLDKGDNNVELFGVQTNNPAN